MNEVTLPPSPNWYLSNVLACAKDGTVAWGARNVIVVGKREQNNAILRYSIISNAHTDRVTSLAFSPNLGEANENLLVSGGDEHIIRVWNLDSMSAFHAYTYPDVKQKVIAVDWSRKDPSLICCVSSDGCLVSWNVSFDTHHQILLGKVVPTCLSCCPHDSNLVVVGSKSGLIYIIDLRKTGTIVYKLRGHDAEIVGLSWCPIETNVLSKTSDRDLLLASGAKDRSVFIWRAGGDGRYQLEITLPNTPLDSHQHRSKLNSAVGNWTAVCWIEPNLLLASSSWGELVAWDLSIMTKNKPMCRLIHACHTRGLFCITSVPHNLTSTSENWRIESSVTVWTLAQDRQVICCNLRNKSASIEYTIPTQGGYVYCIAASPLDTSNIAFGAGDSMLRLWNLSEPHETSFNITTLWQKIKGKVRAISWHPEKENYLAFGTSEGRIGVFDTNANKPPILYRQYHRNIIYSLGWGPNPQKKQYVLYSCAEGELVYYNPEKPNEQPTSVLKKECTEFAWKPDFSCLVVGRENGIISFLNRKLEECGCSILSSKKAVHCLTWHPESTATDLTISPLSNYLAVAFDASAISVLDLSHVTDNLKHLGEEESQDNKPNGVDSSNMHKVVTTLNGHNEKVVCLAWSPHFSGHLISGSYDHTVQVWKVETQELMGTYMGHCAPVHCCMWSPLNPDLIITGSADFTLSIWKLSEQQAIMPTVKAMEKKSRSKKNKHKPDKEKIKDQQVNDNTNGIENKTGSMTNSITMPEKSGINSLNEEKVIPPKDTKRKKPEKGSHLPLYSKMMNGKSMNLSLIKHFIKSMKVSDGDDLEQEECNNDNALSLFTTDDNLLTIIDNERQSHMSQGKYNTVAEMDLWCNNLKDTLDKAVKEKRLNDFLVSLAPSLSVKLWKDMCEAYANQLITENNPHKAVSYLLCIHKTYQAIETFMNSKLYMDAYVLARCKLGPDDPILTKVLEEWAHHNSQTGQFEQASHCYMKAGDLLSAAKFLARRKDTDSLESAADLASLSGDDTLCKALAEEAFTEALLNSDSDTAQRLTKKFSQIKHYKIHVDTFVEIQKILQKTVEHVTIQMWLEDKSEYGILQSIKTDSENDNLYSDLCKRVFPSPGENENLLWVNVSYQMALAVTSDVKENKFRHLVKALSMISEYETVHKVRLENRPQFLMVILCHMDRKSPMSDDSIFSKENGSLSKSLRAYLCLGLLNWIVDDFKQSVIDSNTQPIVDLIENLTEDALDKEVVRYWSITSEINKLENLLTSALGNQHKVETDDTSENTTLLLEKLNTIKNEKKNFLIQRVCSPSPILVYGKGNSLISKLQEENMKDKFLHVLSNSWKKATS